jgi:hypothetical protein
MLHRFWWGHKDNGFKIRWMSWEKHVVSKARKGMGFRNLIRFNKTLLAKQCRCLMQNKDSIASKIIMAKYYLGGTILKKQLGKTPSYAWWSIYRSCDLVKHGLIWRIGDGSGIKIWGDQWLLTPTPYFVQSPKRNLAVGATIRELIDQDTKWWKMI